MRHLLVALALAASAILGSAQAQPFPSRGITLISPFPPGGSTEWWPIIKAAGIKAE